MLCLSFVFLTFPTWVFSQQDLFTEAEKQHDDGNYVKAIELYELDLGQCEDRWERSTDHYCIAECHLKLNNMTAAAYHLKQSYAFDRSDKEVLFEIGDALQRDGKYAEAKRYYKRYPRKYALWPIAQTRIASIAEMEHWANAPALYEVKLNRELSSPFFDFSPCIISSDNRTMMLTSSRFFSDSVEAVGVYQKLYLSYQKDGHWSVPTLLDTVVNKGGVNVGGVVSIDTARGVVFFTTCRQLQSRAGCDIYYSFLQGALMGEPILLSIREGIDTKFTLGHPSFSNTLDVLFFASDMPGGQGGRDIWFVRYDRYSDSWSQPVNAGPGVNSPEDELHPFIAENGVLYYSSAGGMNLGGLDIFSAEQTAPYQWGKGENMKAPINSPMDDFGISFVNGSGSRGFFSSNRKGGLGFDDIYEFWSIRRSEEELSDTAEDSEALTDEERIAPFARLVNREQCQLPTDSVVEDVRLFPNPNDGQFTLQFITPARTRLTMRVFSSGGQLVRNEALPETEGQFSIPMNLTPQPTGIYHLQLLKGCETVWSGKFVKN